MNLAFNFQKFGKFIQEARQLMDLNNSLRNISKQIGISTTTLCRAENGNTIDVNTLLNICHFYQISIQELNDYYIDENSI